MAADPSVSTNLGADWVKEPKKSSRTSVTKLVALHRAMVGLCEQLTINRIPSETEVQHYGQTDAQIEQGIHLTPEAPGLLCEAQFKEFKTRYDKIVREETEARTSRQAGEEAAMEKLRNTDEAVRDLFARQSRQCKADLAQRGLNQAADALIAWEPKEGTYDAAPPHPTVDGEEGEIALDLPLGERANINVTSPSLLTLLEELDEDTVVFIICRTSVWPGGVGPTLGEWLDLSSVCLPECVGVVLTRKAQLWAVLPP